MPTERDQHAGSSESERTQEFVLADYESLRREVEQAKVFESISSIVGSSLAIDDFYARFADEVKKLARFDRLSVNLVDIEREEMIDAYVYGLGQEAWEPGARHSFQSTPTLTAALSGQTVNRDEEDLIKAASNGAEGARVALETGLKSGLAIPLRSQGQVIAVLSITSCENHRYPSSEVRMAENVASLLAAAIVNSQLYEESQRDARERKILAEAALTINSSLDIEEVYQTFASQLKDLIGFDRLGISTISGDHKESTIRHVSGIGAEEFHVGRVLPVAPVATEMINSRRGLCVSKASPEQLCVELGYEGELKGAIEKLGLTSVLTTVLESRDTALGMLTAWSTRQPGYSEHDLQLFQEINQHISSAMANSQLYEDSQRSGTEREILAQASSILHQTLELDEVYGEFAEYIHKLIGYDRIDVSTLNGDPMVGVVQYVAGEAAEEFPPGREMPIFPITAKMIETGKAMLLDFGTSSELSEAAGYEGDVRLAIERYGVTSHICVPLIERGQVTGVLNTYSTKSPGYSEHDLRLLEEVATYISSAMTNSQLYQQTQQEARERALVADIGAAVNADLDLDTVFERVADGLEYVIQFDRLNINLTDPVDDEINWMAYERGLRRPDVGLGERFRSPGLSELVDMCIGDISVEGPPPEQWPIELDLKSLMIVMLRGDGGTPIGTISVRSKTVNEYGDHEFELLKLIAFQVAPAIKNAQLMKRIDEFARVEERSRISLEMQLQKEQSDALNEENIELQRVADARSEFLSTVSHELRTPLTSISAFSDILSRNRPGNLTSQQFDQLEVIRRSVSSLTGLIDDLLDVSRADTGRLKIERAPFEIQSLISEFTDDARSTILGKDQSLVSINIQEPVWIDADRSRIVQVLNNLISNASKYSSPNTQICLRVSSDSGKLDVEVEDQGMGISSHDISNVFTPFFRAPNTETQKESGTGLGLSVVKILVDLHGGEVVLDSELGVGTKVRFWIPGVTSPPDQHSRSPVEPSATTTRE